jgi:hypothetical protein
LSRVIWVSCKCGLGSRALSVEAELTLQNSDSDGNDRCWDWSAREASSSIEAVVAEVEVCGWHEKVQELVILKVTILAAVEL